MTDELKQWEYDKGYEKGKADMLKDIKAEIDDQYKWLMQTKHTLYDIDIAFSGIKSFIDKHIRSDTDE